jgi:diacylglycerol kinase family enzyme
MLKKLDYEYLIASKPCLIEVEGGVTIRIDEDNNLIVSGQKKLSFSGDNVHIDAKNINLHASESFNLNVDGEIYMGSSTHIEQQAPRIDLNPKILTSGYRGKNEG